MARLLRTMTIGCSFFILVAVSGCGNQYHDKLIGTWDTDIAPLNPRFTFNKDGTGTISYGKLATKSIKWRLNGNNLIFSVDGGKDSGALIKKADENRIDLHDPAAPGKKDFSFTRVKG
jgi:hypothetical protein